MHDSVLKNIELDVQKLNAKYGRVVARVVPPVAAHDVLTTADFDAFDTTLLRNQGFVAAEVFFHAKQRQPTHGELIRVGRQCAKRYASFRRGARTYYYLSANWT